MDKIEDSRLEQLAGDFTDFYVESMKVNNNFEHGGEKYPRTINLIGCKSEILLYIANRMRLCLRIKHRKPEVEILLNAKGDNQESYLIKVYGFI